MQRSAGVYRFPLLAKTVEFDPGSKEMHVVGATCTYSYPIAGEKCPAADISIPYLTPYTSYFLNRLNRSRYLSTDRKRYI